MARFPLYIDMQHRKIVIVGGGAVALRKARILTEYGAITKVLSQEFCEGLRMMEARQLLVCEEIRMVPEEFGRVDAAFMVVCATGDRRLNRELAVYCRERGIWVDCADSESDSSCLFPSVVRRQNIVIGISSSGGVPALTRHLRQKIEEIVPEWYGELEESLRIYREKIKREKISQEEKRQQLRQMIAEAERRHQS